jgi:hypothetical protein
MSNSKIFTAYITLYALDKGIIETIARTCKGVDESTIMDEIDFTIYRK